MIPHQLFYFLDFEWMIIRLTGAFMGNGGIKGRLVYICIENGNKNG